MDYLLIFGIVDDMTRRLDELEASLSAAEDAGASASSAAK